jgi:hypothetical protein
MVLRKRQTRPGNRRKFGAAGRRTGTKSSHLEKDRTLNYIAISLQELNEDQRKCIQLFYLEKKSYQYIAENTGYTLMQVKSHIQNGKRNLKIMVEKNEGQLIMPNDFDDILKNDSGEFDQQRLLKYLDGSASPEERHEVERLMADSKFTNDAVEGLQALKNKKDITLLVHDLNKNLHQQLIDRKKSKEKRRIKEG